MFLKFIKFIIPHHHKSTAHEGALNSTRRRSKTIQEYKKGRVCVGIGIKGSLESSTKVKFPLIDLWAPKSTFKSQIKHKS